MSQQTLRLTLLPATKEPNIETSQRTLSPVKPTAHLSKEKSSSKRDVRRGGSPPSEQPKRKQPKARKKQNHLSHLEKHLKRSLEPFQHNFVKAVEFFPLVGAELFSRRACNKVHSKMRTAAPTKETAKESTLV